MAASEEIPAVGLDLHADQDPETFVKLSLKRNITFLLLHIWYTYIHLKYR